MGSSSPARPVAHHKTQERKLPSAIFAVRLFSSSFFSDRRSAGAKHDIIVSRESIIKGGLQLPGRGP
ncbi:hypothetical protein OJAV_G00132720 [Oryzias javanicus]|uniref:Uncharacterized protein n=1 Tax=Oryzias javanicus TaxID=123683 RepID=A0A437CQH1_ORYJA|nr:hypothetical protein OJAV_G00132720 [Oryzias javanicus]